MKDNNILIDAELNVPIIIDFGLSFSKDDLVPTKYEDVFFNFVDYSYWCIDIVACSYIFNIIGYERSKTELVQEHQLNEIYNMFLYGNETAMEQTEIVNHAFQAQLINSKVHIQTFKKMYWTFFSKFMDKPWWELYEELIKYVDTWDNYSIAVIYARLIDRAYFANSANFEKAFAKNQSAMNLYMNGLERVLYAAPNERLSIAEFEKYVPK